MNIALIATAREKSNAGETIAFAALGLLAMTIVTQFTVPDGWPIHLTWAAMALGIITWGTGRLSVDWWHGARRD